MAAVFAQKLCITLWIECNKGDLFSLCDLQHPMCLKNRRKIKVFKNMCLYEFSERFVDRYDTMHAFCDKKQIWWIRLIVNP